MRLYGRTPSPYIQSPRSISTVRPVNGRFITFALQSHIVVMRI